MVDRTLDFLVSRSNLRECKLHEDPGVLARGLSDREVVLRVDSFGLTANNITYGVAGDLMHYWAFFPASDDWGRVPVWGFGEVARSDRADLPEGTRVYGYFPMSTHLRVLPGDVRDGRFVDRAPHRAALPPNYNNYQLCQADPLYEREREGLMALFRPLFTTGFLLDDYLADAEFFGADAIVLTSASSKTAAGLAQLLSQRLTRPRIVGLTSERHRAFVEGLGCYDEVVAYSRVETLPGDRSVVLVDLAGNGDVRAQVHRHHGEGVKHSALVGMTHWEAGAAPGEPLPGAQPEFFFAPTYGQKRVDDWGAEGVGSRVAQAWKRFTGVADGWLDIHTSRGADAVKDIYMQTLEGQVPPNVGHILSLHE